MSLPVSNNRTYAANQSVSSSDLVDLQDQIHARWRGRHKLRGMNVHAFKGRPRTVVTAGNVVQQWNTHGDGYRESATATSDEQLWFDFGCRYGTRVHKIEVSWRRAGGGLGFFELYRQQHDQDLNQTPLLSGSILGTLNTVTIVQLVFTSPPAVSRRFAGVDTDFSIVITPGNVGDRIFGIMVWYDHLGIGDPAGL